MHYSPSKNSCFATESRPDYEVNGLWPADAVEITSELYAVVVSNRPADKIMVPGADGLPMLADPPAPTLAEATAVARVAIDAEAGAARARYITVAPGQETTYMLKEAQSRAYKAAGYPSATVGDYPMVDAEAQALHGAAPTAAQIQSATDGIIAQADAWIAKAAQIERARIAGKRAVAAAVDVAGVESARAAAVAELGAL